MGNRNATTHSSAGTKPSAILGDLVAAGCCRDLKAAKCIRIVTA